MKRKMIKEKINNSKIREKLFIEQIKYKKYLIKFIVHVDNKTFDYQSLM